MATKKKSQPKPKTAKKKNKKVTPANEPGLVAQPEPTAQPDTKRLFWVGIGASAGGLEALRQFVARLPEKGRLNITYIVAQHLSPKHQSMLVQLLSRETDIPVKELKNGQKPKPDTIYITPPDRDVFVQDGTLKLRAPLSEYSPKPSIDYFFTTLAEDQEDHAIGVILSGTGSDGSHGVRAIRAEGGMTIAQSIETSKFDGMPGNAIDTGCVDIILPPEKMGPELASIIESPKTMKLLHEEAQRTDIQELLHLLKQRSKVDFKDYKTGTLYRRINRRMAACSCGDLENYIEHVKKNPQELDALYNDILICVTSFFRDKDAFDKVKDYAQEILNGKESGDDIRIWVPGCATGEEAYSIVILFAELAGGMSALSNYNFQVFASDIDNDILARARRGVYAQTTLEYISKEIRDKYFRNRENAYEIKKAVRDMVVFSKHNVFEDPPFLRLDMISCRNLLIYFNNKLQQNVMKLFHYSLNHEGVLFLGKSESLGQATKLFSALDSKAKIFRKKMITSNERDVFSHASYVATRRIETPAAGGKNSSIHDLPDAVIQAFSADSLLIDESMNVIRIYGNVDDYTQLSAGSASMNLMSIAKKSFRQEVRALVYKILRENATVTVLPKKMNIRGKYQLVHISIRLLNIRHTPEKLLLVSFDKIKKLASNESSDEPRETDDPIVAELEQELASTREHLQTVVEELETSNEELQSTNEELQSSNEELQSSNEELETANEELQSTNEELLTVNEELQIKTHQLSLMNEDLGNVKESIGFPLIAVSRELKVKLYNTAAKQLFRLNGDVKGEILTSIPTSIDLGHIRGRINDVMKADKLHEQQIDTDEKCYYERIVPYRTDANNVDGVILTYIENTEIRKVEQRLEQSEERYHLAVNGASVGIWDWNIEADSLYCSEKFLDILELDENSPQARDFEFIEKRIHVDDREDVLDILKAHLDKGFDFNVEFRIRVGPGGYGLRKDRKRDYKWVHMRGQSVWDKAENRAVRMSGSMHDISETRAMIAQLRESNDALSRFAFICSHDLKEPARASHSLSNILLEDYSEQLDDEGKSYLDQRAGKNRGVAQKGKE